MFEFGKRYRNTIRVCPFSSIAMIGGFGNLTGEIDFWALDSMEQLGSTKSYCSIGIEWSPDGTTLMTSVLYERVKVDNVIGLFAPSGKKLLGKGEAFDVLSHVEWQPVPAGTYKRANIKAIKVEAQQEKDKKPKRVFAYGGGNSAFSQIMRQEMGKASDTGPRKLDAGSQQAYKQISTEQSEKAKEKVTKIQNQKSQQAEAPKEKTEFANWRTGNFKDNTPKEVVPQEDLPYGANI